MPPIALPYLAVARVTGADAAAFLQAQLSADIAALEVGEASFACYCTPRGQVLGLLLVGREVDDFWLVGSAALLPGILQRLRLYVLRSRVELAPAPDRACYGLTTESQDVGTAFHPGGVGLAYAIGSASAESDAAEATHWKAGELRAGIAWLGPETTERFIPQMLGFEGIGAVSFAKGCYPGQEIVARARYLGKVKRRPALLELGEALDFAPGTALRLLAGEDWLDARLVDSAVAPARDGGESTVLFTVAATAEFAITSLEFDGARYRCATI